MKGNSRKMEVHFEPCESDQNRAVVTLALAFQIFTGQCEPWKLLSIYLSKYWE